MTNAEYVASSDRFSQTIAPLAPIVGSTFQAGVVTIDFRPAATQPQKDAAALAAATFDWSAAAQAAWQDQQNPDRTNVKQQAQSAIATNNAFLAIVGNPTNAQVLAQVQALTQEMTAVIKYLNDLATAG